MNIKKINYNEEQYDGCETCDYGSQYINNLEIILDDDTTTTIAIDNMYEFAFSEANLMELLYASTTIEDFIVSATKKFVQAYRSFYTHITVSDNDIRNHLSNLDITYNGKNVDAKETFYHNALIYVGDKDVAWENFVNKSKDASPYAIKEYADDYARVVAEYGSAEYEEAFKKALNYTNKLVEPKLSIINEANYIPQNILPWEE